MYYILIVCIVYCINENGQNRKPFFFNLILYMSIYYFIIIDINEFVKYYIMKC
jgi:hypothetical protein